MQQQRLSKDIPAALASIRSSGVSFMRDDALIFQNNNWKMKIELLLQISF